MTLGEFIDTPSLYIVAESYEMTTLIHKCSTGVLKGSWAVYPIPTTGYGGHTDSLVGTDGMGLLLCS